MVLISKETRRRIFQNQSNVKSQDYKYISYDSPRSEIGRTNYAFR